MIQFCSVIFHTLLSFKLLTTIDLCVYLSVETFGREGEGRGDLPYKMDGGTCCSFQGLSEKAVVEPLLIGVLHNSNEAEHPKGTMTGTVILYIWQSPTQGADHSLTSFFCFKEYMLVFKLILFAVPTRGDRGRDKVVNSVQEVIKWCLVSLQKNWRSNYNTIQ